MPTDPPELTDSEYQALARLRYSLRVFLRFSEEAARGAGLTPKQHQLLLAIRGFPGTHEPTVGDVAHLLQLRHHSVVELVDRAVDAGLVRRRIDTDDHRRHRLALTARGTRKLASLTPMHQIELRRFRDEMNELLRDLP